MTLSRQIRCATVMGAALLIFSSNGSLANPAGSETAAVTKNAHDSALINRVAFEGNRKVEKAQLAAAVVTRANRPADPATIKADEERIRAIYLQAGRGNAHVTSRLVDLPNGKVDVVFAVAEGDKTGVKEIRYVGNHAFSASRLRKIMTISETNILSFLKNNDIYNPDQFGNDLERVRRYYIKNGYADFRVVSSDVKFDANAAGYIITITVDEGRQSTVGAINIESRIPGVDAETLKRDLSISSGSLYNAEAVERSVENMTAAVVRQGHSFAQVRRTFSRDPATGSINLAYMIEDGPPLYIERINIRGNTRTRDNVIRREFDVGEGDPYNTLLIGRAEHRLKNLGFFKTVRISNEPGSAPDRVVLNVDVEDQPTGSFSVAGGYSTADGFIAEASISETNFLGRGQSVRIGGQVGQNTLGANLSLTEPYFLGSRMAAGIDLYSKYSDLTEYSRYTSQVTGGQLRLGLPITDEFSVTARYSLYLTDVQIPNDTAKPYNDCSVPISGYTALNPDGSPNKTFCQGNGEASIAVKQAVGSWLTSVAGLTMTYNTLDNTKDPHNGFYAELKPDIAGLGGDSNFARLTGDARYYREISDDVVGIVRVQAGHVGSSNGNNLRLTDQFFLGPSLVRGFAPSGIGPRDVSTLDSKSSALGGTTYAGASTGMQFSLPGVPSELGLKGAVFADAGSLFGYQAGTTFDMNKDGIVNGLDPVSKTCVGSSLVASECVKVNDSKKIRSSIGAGLLWDSPLGPLRVDYAFPLSKAAGDVSQRLRFSTGQF